MDPGQPSRVPGKDGQRWRMFAYFTCKNVLGRPLLGVGKYFEKSSKSPNFALTWGLSLQDLPYIARKKVRTRSEQPVELPDMDGYWAT
jgi:hypothetical protein